MMDHSSDSFTEAIGVDEDSVIRWLTTTAEEPDVDGKPSKMFEKILESDLAELDKMYASFLVGQALVKVAQLKQQDEPESPFRN